ncbi:MAG: hypothetical protein ACP6KW_00900 [Candidatus Thorarchaeota archaeon]
MSEEHSDDKKKASSDAEELREIAAALPELLGAINESIPRLIQGLIGSIYSPESAGNMAKGIGQFYSNLVAEGIPEDVALDMTKKFVGALDFSKMLSMVTSEMSSDSKRRRKKPSDLDYDEETEDVEFDE